MSNTVHTDFDPDGVGQANGNLFGLPFGSESKITIVPVPWDVTTSYGDGTSNGPQAILAASPQLDLYDFDVEDPWKEGIYMLPIEEDMVEQNQQLRQQASAYIQFLEQGGDIAESEEQQAALEAINAGCAALKDRVKTQTAALLEEGKLVGLLGGDHSTPLGFLEALAERYDDFGILQIDAHADLREAYEGFEYSHASIFHKALQLPQISRLIQVGVRDISKQEVATIEASEKRIVTYYDHDLKEELYWGNKWKNLCDEMVRKLPSQVYISFDIDGLDPKLCPNSGTPVPGGLDFPEAIYLLKRLAESGRTIIGFDLCEVAPGNNDWDGNVGARLLYKLCGFLKSTNQ